MIFIPACTIFTTLLMSAYSAVFASESDSLAFESLRSSVAADSTSPALSTADALAEAGLYAEATEILFEHSPGVGKSAGPTAAAPVKWYLSSGVDHYHLEDVDTVTMTREELRDYKRLTETPLSLWLRARSAMKPAAGFVEEIAPEAYISERKGSFETSARFSSRGGLVALEPSVKAEKWFQADASGSSSFAPLDTQDSDMGGAALRLAAGNTARPRERIEWNMPLSIDWEHRRADRPGYESLLEYRFMPSFQLSAKSLPLQGRFSAHAEYEDYYDEASDTLDVVRLSTRAEAHSRTSKFTAFLSGAWMGDRYTNMPDPESIDRFEAVFRGEYKAAPSLSARIRLRAIHEGERHGAHPDAPAFALGGSEVKIEPAIEASAGKHIKLCPEILFERRRADMSGSRFLWESRSVWEPGLRIEWHSGILLASVRGSFRAEEIDDAFESFTADNRSFRGSAEASMNAGRLLTINLFADYQYRRYAPYSAHARVSENLTVSAAVSARL